ERRLPSGRRELGADLEQLAARRLENPLCGRGNGGRTRRLGVWLSVGGGAWLIVLRGGVAGPAKHRHCKQQDEQETRGEHHVAADHGGNAAGRKRVLASRRSRA